MGTDGRRANRFASEAGRLVDGARALSRGSGRLAVLNTLSRARAKVSGQEPSLRWVPSELAPRYDVIVVGATLGGLFLADELAQRLEARVGLLEADRVGGDWPSRCQTALAVTGERPALAEVVAGSRAAYERLAAQAFPLSFGHLDVVTLARSGSELDRLSARAGLGSMARPAGRVPGPAGHDGLRLVTPAVADALIPHLGPGLVGALVEANVTTIRAATLPWQLASAAARRGVAIVEHCGISGATRAGGAWTLSTTAGRTEAPLVVDATAGAEALAAAGLDHQCLWRRWLTLTTDPVQPFLRAQVRSEGVAIQQTEQGEISISGEVGQSPPGAAAWLACASSLAETAVAALPLLGQLRLVSRAWRSDLVPADGLPVVGPVAGPGDAEGLCRLGGLGSDPLALAPAAAEALARYLVDEEPTVSLRAFDPTRLAGSGVPPRTQAAAK